jgi:hypothetical protein
MTVKKIDLETTHLTLEELLAELDRDTEVLLTRGDNPVARVAYVEPSTVHSERILGLHEGEGWMSEDFNDELPDSFWLGSGKISGAFETLKRRIGRFHRDISARPIKTKILR